MWVFEGRGGDVFFQERYFGYDLGPSSHPRRVSGVEPNPGSFPDLGPSSYPRWVSGVEPNPGSNAGQIQLSHINRHTYLAKEKRHLSQVPFHFI